LGPGCRVVRAILFDKSTEANWSLAWHQDRTIAVAERASLAGFDNWTVKSGTTHVEPPFSIIEGMVTARIHFDDVDADNAPLLISPGSHQLGKIPEERLAAVVEEYGQDCCLGTAGDVWLYRTAIVHASARAQVPRRRRVLQLDYSAAELPKPLRWALTF
jgi:ectoine hydroxylase-related dioxygenase (phytanoyl-CoA dioxygenase family)